MKVEANYTDWESLTLNSSGSDVSSKITAEPEQTSFKISIGYNF
tara:strand:- start:310 stop:441 length:132 start_codon:yes stop_codon:yes gene_type:complete